MTKLTKVLGVSILSLGLFVGVAAIASAASPALAGQAPADTLQPAQTITYNEEVVVNNTIKVNSAYIGSTAAGVGGVTFFNGSIVNNSVDSDGNSTIPVTFADDVRIDGEIYRTEKGGDNAIKISDHVIPTATATNNFGTSSNRWNSVSAVDGNFSGTLTVATLAPTTLSGTGIVTSTNLADGAVAAADLASSAVTSAKIAASAVTSAKIADGTIASGDLADSAVTSAKITDGTIANGDLANNSVTPAKIEGTGGANLPVAYGVVNGLAYTVTGTSNVTGVTHAGAGDYKVSFSGITYDHDNYVTVVSPLTSAGAYRINYAHDGSGSLDVYTYDASDAASDISFSFVIYQL